MHKKKCRSQQVPEVFLPNHSKESGNNMWPSEHSTKKSHGYQGNCEGLEGHCVEPHWGPAASFQNHFLLAACHWGRSPTLPMASSFTFCHKEIPMGKQWGNTTEKPCFSSEPYTSPLHEPSHSLLEQKTERLPRIGKKDKTGYIVPNSFTTLTPGQVSTSFVSPLLAVIKGNLCPSTRGQLPWCYLLITSGLAFT